MADAKSKIVELFEKHRAAPGMPYDEVHFLDFLLPEPKRKGALYDSFRGQQRFGAFLDEVQLEFGVCFSIKDREANYSLDHFVTRITKLQQSKRGSLRSLQRQIRDGPGWGMLLLANVALLTVADFATGIPWAIVSVFIIAVALNVGFALFAWQARTYLLKLQKRTVSR